MKKLPKLQKELPPGASAPNELNMSTRFALVVVIRSPSNASSDVEKSRRAKEQVMERARLGKSRRR